MDRPVRSVYLDGGEWKSDEKNGTELDWLEKMFVGLVEYTTVVDGLM